LAQKLDAKGRLSPATGPAVNVAREIDVDRRGLVLAARALDHRDRLADDEAIARNGNMVLESAVPRPEFLVVALGAGRDLVNEVVQ
jgi:hypothetical protein